MREPGGENTFAVEFSPSAAKNLNVTMLPDTHQWFSEVCREAGSAISYAVEAHLHHEATPFQTIDIYRTTHWGNLMAIDGCVMLTARDNFLYHEMLVHPALYSHPDPKRVLIIGGGDCGTLREVLHHAEVTECTQVEIDERVTRLSEKYFPELCTANGDPRAQLLFQDGLEYIRALAPGDADVVIVDSTDPVGPAEGLFGPEFVKDCFRALGEHGVMVQQSESPLLHGELIRGIRQNMQQAGFADIRTLPFPQPCYPSGWWSATVAKRTPGLDDFRCKDAQRRPFPTRYYTAEVHRGALAPPVLLQGDGVGPE